MKQIFGALLFIAAAATLGACSNDPTVLGTPDTTGDNATFVEVDRIGKPGIKELYLPFDTHAGYNVATPDGDPSAYGPAVANFVTGTAGRSTAIAGFVSTLLLPDALIANVTDTSARASYLGWETGGQITADCTGLPGTTFGGRALDDDVVDVDLGLAFGNLATSTVLTNASALNVPATPPPDDGAEKNGSNGTPNLTKQNVSCAGLGFTPTQFPYLAAPI